MEHPNLIVNDKFIDEVCKHSNAYLILDYSEESIPLNGSIAQKFIELHRILKEHKFDCKRIFVVSAGNLAEEEYEKFCIDNKIINKLNIIGFNPLLFRNVYWLVSNKWFSDIAQKIINFSVDRSQIREKKFMSLNLRPRSHQQH
jgi:hypothetical protein